MHALGDSGSSSPHLDSKLPADDTAEPGAATSSSNILAVPRADADEEMASQKKKVKDAKKKSLKRL